jgi:hypothetical protein
MLIDGLRAVLGRTSYTRAGSARERNLGMKGTVSAVSQYVCENYISKDVSPVSVDRFESAEHASCPRVRALIGP